MMFSLAFRYFEIVISCLWYSAIAEAINKRYKNFNKDLVEKIEVSQCPNCGVGSCVFLSHFYMVFKYQKWIIKTLTSCLVILQYDPDARMVVVDVKKPKGERKSDLAHMAYYMEKDVCIKK